MLKPLRIWMTGCYLRGCEHPSEMIITKLARRWRMGFDPRRMFNIEVAGIATLVLSAVMVVSVLYSIWR